jgi:hypothetical protein
MTDTKDFPQVVVQKGRFPPLLRRNKKGRVVIVTDYSLTTSGHAVGGTQTDVTDQFVALCVEYDREVKAMMIEREMEDARKAVDGD